MIERIQRVMDHYGLTVSAFADGIGVQRSSISHLLNGRNRPSLDFVMKLIDAYPEVDLYWLLLGKGDFPRKASQGALDGPGPKVDRKASGDPFPLPPVGGGPLGDPQGIVLLFGDGSFKTYGKKKD